MENISEHYLKELGKTNKPAYLLSKMFWELFDKYPDNRDVGLIGKLVKLYGRENVFYSILDMYGMDNVDLVSYYGLVSFFCKKRLDRSDTNQSVDLTDFADKVKKDIERKTGRNLKIRNPIDE